MVESLNPYRRNLRLFVAFRVLFNARFYYPVLGVLFLDLGLSLEQYAILNVVWAGTIILLEVPSGGLADLVGRRPMVLTASGLMVLEIALFAFAPSGPLLFPLLILNRIVSGAAEACASGADEAMAYDSLPGEGREDAWREVLATLVRWSSSAFFVAMLVGAAVFDSELVNRVWAGLGFATQWTSAETLRWPLYLTLGSAVLACVVAFFFREPPRERVAGANPIRAALANIRAGAEFVFSSRRILLLLLAGVLFDSVVRLFLTFASNYYRLIEIPAFANGLLGSAYAVLGFVAAWLARRMASGLNPMGVAAVLGGILMVGLLGLCAATPVWGVWVLIPLGLVMPMTGYFLSNYLNAWTSSELRATVLSFRGMAINVGYGLFGLGFAGVTAAVRGAHPGLGNEALFGKTLFILPVAFAVGSLLLGAFAWATARRDHST